MSAKPSKERGFADFTAAPMLRALQTAEIIGRVLSLPPHIYVGLHEWDGIWGGQRRQVWRHTPRSYPNANERDLPECGPAERCHG